MSTPGRRMDPPKPSHGGTVPVCCLLCVAHTVFTHPCRAAEAVAHGTVHRRERPIKWTARRWQPAKPCDGSLLTECVRAACSSCMSTFFLRCDISVLPVPSTKPFPTDFAELSSHGHPSNLDTRAFANPGVEVA